MTSELELLWLPNFIPLGIYFIFGIKFSWNEGNDTCFNVEYVLLDRNFDFLGGYLMVTARYLVVTARYFVVTDGYCSLLVVTACYRLFPLLVWTKNAILGNISVIHFQKCPQMIWGWQRVLETQIKTTAKKVGFLLENFINFNTSVNLKASFSL